MGSTLAAPPENRHARIFRLTKAPSVGHADAPVSTVVAAKPRDDRFRKPASPPARGGHRGPRAREGSLAGSGRFPGRALNQVVVAALPRLGLLLLSLLAPWAAGGASHLHAQQVTGRVVDDADNAPVPVAEVRVLGADTWTTSNQSGMFSLTLHPGTHTVEARALGYRTATVQVVVDPDQPAMLELRLARRPLAMEGITVSALRPDLMPRAEMEGRQVDEANPKDSGELLRAVEGVEAVRRGPLGLDPVVRGLRETEIGTYMDGARMFPAGPARMDSPLTHVDPSAVRSIEVVKGPYALTWGAGNLSAIRVETQPLPDAATAARGSFATGFDSNVQATEATGKLYGKNGGVAYFLHGAFREGDDYQPGGGGDLVQGDFRSWEARGKLGFDVGSEGRLVLSGGYQEQGPIDYPGRLLSAEFFESTNLMATFDWSGEGLVRGFHAQAYHNRVDHGMDNIDKPTRMAMPNRMPPFALDVTVDSHMAVSGGRMSLDLHLDDAWSGEVGGDVYLSNRDAQRSIARLETGMVMFEDLMWPDADINDSGVFGRLSHSRGNLRFAGTVRADFVQASAARASEFFLANVGPDLDATERNVSGAMTLSVDVGGNWTMTGGVGSAVRTADANERYSDRIPASKAQMSAEFMGNPHLAPERSLQGDLWIDGRFERLTVHFGAFGRKMFDYITIEATDLPKRLPLSPNTVFRYVNGEATFRGLETSLTVALSDAWTADGGVAYLHGRDDAVDEPAIGVSPLRASLGLRYEDPTGRFYTEGRAHIVGAQDQVASSRGELATPSYRTADVRAGYGLMNGVTLRGGVLNIWDEHYADHLNAKNPFTGIPVPEPGRMFFIDVAWSF